MISKYPFQVVVWRTNGNVTTLPQTKSFETLGAAGHYAEAEQRSPSVKRVEILAIIDQWNKPG
jgi:hypothetical protein